MLDQAHIAWRTAAADGADASDAVHGSKGSTTDAHSLLLLLADGEGCTARGRRAGPIAVEILRACLTDRLARIRDADARVLRQRVAETLREGLRRANREVWRQCKGESAARLAGFVVLPHHTLAFSVGNAQGYFIDADGQIEHLTRDVAQDGETVWLLGRSRRLPDRAVFLDAYHTAEDGFYFLCSDGLERLGEAAAPDRIAEVVLHTRTVEAALDFLFSERAGGAGDAAAALAEIGTVARRGEVPPPPSPRERDRADRSPSRRPRTVPLPPPARPGLLPLIGEVVSDAEPLIRIGAVFAVGVGLSIVALQAGGSWLERLLTLRTASGPSIAPAIQFQPQSSAGSGATPGALQGVGPGNPPGGAGSDGPGSATGSPPNGAGAGPGGTAGAASAESTSLAEAGAKGIDSAGLPAAPGSPTPSTSASEATSSSGEAETASAEPTASASRSPESEPSREASRPQPTAISKEDSGQNRKNDEVGPEAGAAESPSVGAESPAQDELSPPAIAQDPAGATGLAESAAAQSDGRDSPNPAGTAPAPSPGMDREAGVSVAGVAPLNDGVPPTPPLELVDLDAGIWKAGEARALAQRNLLRQGQESRSPGFFAGETLLHLTIFDAAEYAAMHPAALVLIRAAVIVPPDAPARPSPLYRRVRAPVEPQTRTNDRWIYSFPIADLQSALDIREGEAWRLTFQLHFAPIGGEVKPGEDALHQGTLAWSALVRQAGPFRLPSR